MLSICCNGNTRKVKEMIAADESARQYVVVEDRLFLNYVYLLFYKKFLDKHNVDKVKCKKIIRKMGNFLEFFMELTEVDIRIVKALAQNFVVTHSCQNCGKLRNFVKYKTLHYH